ncbi:hypothetical protein [Bradyrhizobium stylosanthis]|uniref:hypothetical protein n=1 Tax=Bradyrhizobium stylosanthis TaxID=1803665 RepID=UPI0011A2EDF2|nr:hypothetical protein [Bradyrhizobium stylosanthis]
MNSGDTAYSWQLASGSSISISRDGQTSASGSSRAYACKVNVVALPNGTIKSLDTEDKDSSLDRRSARQRLRRATWNEAAVKALFG